MKLFVVAMVISLGFLSLTVLAIRRRRLRDQAAVLWLAVSLVMVLCSLALPLHLLDHVSHVIGIATRPTCCSSSPSCSWSLWSSTSRSTSRRSRTARPGWCREYALLRAEAPQPPAHDRGAELRLTSHAEPLA